MSQATKEVGDGILRIQVDGTDESDVLVDLEASGRVLKELAQNREEQNKSTEGGNT